MFYGMYPYGSPGASDMFGPAGFEPVEMDEEVAVGIWGRPGFSPWRGRGFQRFGRRGRGFRRPFPRGFGKGLGKGFGKGFGKHGKFGRPFDKSFGKGYGYGKFY